MAIERKKKVVTLPDWPEIKIFYFAPARMGLGVTEVREGDIVFHIFDIEKTIVDIIYYRNKIGIEETSEVLRNYLKRRDRQIDRLYAYAGENGSIVLDYQYEQNTHSDSQFLVEALEAESVHGEPVTIVTDGAYAGNQNHERAKGKISS